MRDLYNLFTLLLIAATGWFMRWYFVPRKGIVFASISSLMGMAWAFVVCMVVFNGKCFHRIIEGEGLMSDTCRCEKCGKTAYDIQFAFLGFYRLIGRSKELPAAEKS